MAQVTYRLQQIAFASEVAKHRIPPGHDPVTGLPAAAPPAGEGSSTPAAPPDGAE